MQIAIDGYNFIKQTPEFRRLEQIDLQKAREGLIDLLAQYKRLKGYPITVVFDGTQAGRVAGDHGPSKGVKVVFSKPGEKADDVLKRMAAEAKGGILIVTSDQEVASFADKKGAATISVGDFGTKVEMARFYSAEGGEGENSYGRSAIAPRKKGPSKRLSKSKRRALAAAKKL
jgi:predicted RNA-binding protein with PIN domain